MSDAIVAEGLVKKYGAVVALDEMSLSVPAGTVFGLVGPNGAGKTTMVRILTTLVRPDAGHATVAGFDVVADARRLRSHIGVSGQYAAVDEDLTGMENLEMVGRRNAAKMAIADGITMAKRDTIKLVRVVMLAAFVPLATWRYKEAVSR